MIWPFRRPRHDRSPDAGTRFDALFRDGQAFDPVTEREEDLLSDLVARIEGPRWQPTRDLPRLTEAESTVVWACRFSGIFGNGGLQYWLEADLAPAVSEPGIVGTFRRCDLHDAATAMEAFYALLRRDGQPVPDDVDERLARIEPVRDEFDQLDRALWQDFDEVEPRATMWIRAHRQELEHLRTVRPWHAGWEERFGTS